MTAFETFNKFFPKEKREELQAKAERTDPSRHIETLDFLMNSRDPVQEAWRIHLTAWLEFCESHSGLTADRAARLTKLDDWEAWVQVLNELTIPYFLERVFGAKVTYIPETVSQKTADIRLDKQDQTVYVEIKTPGRGSQKPPSGTGRSAKDTKSIKSAISAANEQFDRKHINILALGADLLEVSPSRRDCFVIEALYGTEKLSFSINLNTGARSGPMETVFAPDGKLQPKRFTRVSAVIVFRDESGYPISQHHKAPHAYHCAVYHNPHAISKLPVSCFLGVQQLVFDTNGAPQGLNLGNTRYTFRGY